MSFEILNDKSNKSYIFPFLILLSVYAVHYLFFAPFWPLDHDTFYKLLSIKENFDFNMRDHHHWRWGSYIIYKLFSLFINQNFITITSISFIIFLFSALIFSYCVHINLGLLYSVIFVIFWITSKALYLEIFSFSVVNHSLLVLSILLFYLQRLKISDHNLLSAFILGLIFFWLYAIKETNVFFFPLLFFFKIFRENLLFILKILIVCLFLYILETIFFNFLSD